MRTKNSVWIWSYSTRYYLTHPWKWIRELFRNIGDMWRRSIYGWTYIDVWNLNDFILGILPDMLKHMADYGSAYPGIKPFDEPEKWHNWLHSMADVLESLQEEHWYSQNEYEKDFYEMAAFAREVEQKHPNLTMTYNFNEQDMKDLSALYFQRAKELTEEREYLLENTGRELFKYLPLLWD